MAETVLFGGKALTNDTHIFSWRKRHYTLKDSREAKSAQGIALFLTGLAQIRGCDQLENWSTALGMACTNASDLNGKHHMKRSRGRNRRSGGNNANNHNNPNRHYESVGPDVKIRGSAQQVLDKYQQYARDAQTSGDRILSEAYFQFAEHYQRIVAKQQEARDRQQQQRQQERAEREARRGDREDAGREEAENADTPAADVQVEETKPSSEASGETAETADQAETGDAEASDAGDAEEAPKRGRGRPRKKYAKKDKPSDEGEADGVLKTVSRGRRRAVEENDSSEDTQEEAADQAS